MKRHITTLAFIAALCSCTKTEPAPVPDPDPVPVPKEIIIGVGSDATKTSLSGTSVLWAEDDLIQVFSNTNHDGVDFKLKDGAGTTSALFTNKIYEEEDPVEVSGSAFYLCYPAGNYTFDGSRFTTNLSPSVSYVEGSFGVGANPSFGSGDNLAGGSFVMKNLCGLIKIALKGSMKVSEVDLTLDKNIAGEASFAIPSAGSAPVLEMSSGSGASKTIAMHCDAIQLNKTTATDFIFVVPAGSYSHLDIAVYDDSGTPTVMSKNISLVVERAASLGLSSTLPDNGVAGTIEMMTEIPFGDANLEKDREEIKAVSFNVRAQRNEDGVTSAQKWTTRRDAVYDFFTQNQYDIIGTQECEYRQKENIMDNVSGYGVYGRGSEYGKDDDEEEGYFWDKKYHSQDSGNYIFYRTDKYTLRASGIFWLSDTPSKVSKFSSSNHYRTCVWVRLESNATGQQFNVFNTHLDNTDDGVRGQQLDVLWAQIQSLNSTGKPMIMMGDLNMTTTNSPLETFRKSGKMFFARNEKNVCFDDAHKSYNCFGEYDGRSNIDHIAYKDFYKIKSFETDIAEYHSVAYISDHYPIIATLLFN